MEHDPIALHARRFAWRAAHIYGAASSTGQLTANASPLYAHLATKIADDPDIIRLVLGADSHTTVANLLFGAVHFLLLGGVAHPLADFYATLVPQPQPVSAAYPHFRDFCLTHSVEIQQIVNTRTVQTNEAQRCTGLLPAFTWLAHRVNHEPLALIEVGAEAGLYLTCQVRGDNHLSLSVQPPQVASRVGIELNPVDPLDEAAVRWVQALIWPEHVERHERFRQALAILLAEPPPMIAGDMVELLPNVLAESSAAHPLCLYHSYTLNQCPRQVGEALHDLLIAHSQQRTIYRLALEWYNGQEHPHLDLFTYREEQVTQELLAYCESHGRWIEWLAHR